MSTLKQWCIKNGYGGVTKECLLSANNSKNEELVKKVKNHMLEGIARK